MSLKEKYSRICSIKEHAMSLLELGMSQDVKNINSKELYELMDIIKDSEETIKLAEEANYYHKVTEAMDESSSEEKSMYLNKYIPEYNGKFYTPIKYMNRVRNQYDTPIENDWNDWNDSSMHRDYREGRSPMVRRTYMEMKEHGENEASTTKELERYINELGEDMSEMISDMTTSEKSILKQKLATLASKIS